MNGSESQYEGLLVFHEPAELKATGMSYVWASSESKAVYRATIVNRTLVGISKIEQPLRSGASTGAINR